MQNLNDLLTSKVDELLGESPEDNTDTIGDSSSLDEIVSNTTEQEEETKEPNSLSQIQINQLNKFIIEAENALKNIKAIIGGEEVKDVPQTSIPKTHTPSFEQQKTSQGSAQEGVFNGCSMVGSDGKDYPVPPNYASKSKLVEGDMLKVTITANGTLIYKQIGPIERERRIGELVFKEDGSYCVVCDNRPFSVLTAAVTYHKGLPGQRVVILTPKDTPSKWAAVEYIKKD